MGMGILRTPTVDHIRFECPKFYTEQFFQIGLVNMGRVFSETAVAASFIDRTHSVPPPAEDTDLATMLTQSAEDMIYPVNTAHRLTVNMRLYRSRYRIA